MSLDATVRVRLGDFDLDVEVGAPSGAVTAVVGPNGAGKTTLLRAISGALGIDSGSIVLDGVVLDAPPAVFVAPQGRRLGIVHQDYLLFPHLTAIDNVAFGPRSAGRSKAQAREVAADLLGRFGIGDLAGLRPADLSGGQAQRVALARALATEPAALLLDEPLSALDATTRVEVRRDLRRMAAGFAGPIILVAHDPIDVAALAERVAVIEAGRLTQEGTLAEVASRPRSRYAAELFGTNLLSGAVAGDTLVTGEGATLTVAERSSGDVFATIAPNAVALHRSEPEGSPRNRWATTVRHIDVLGDRLRVQLGPPIELVAEITPAAGAELGLREGEAVWASVKATEIRTSPR